MMPNKDNIEKLITEYNRRLQILKKQEASMGLNTPAHILIEIEDLEAKIEALQAELEALQTDNIDVPSQKSPLTLLENSLGTTIASSTPSGTENASEKTQDIPFFETKGIRIEGIRFPGCVVRSVSIAFGALIVVGLAAIIFNDSDFRHLIFPAATDLAAVTSTPLSTYTSVPATKTPESLAPDTPIPTFTPTPTSTPTSTPAPTPSPTVTHTPTPTPPPPTPIICPYEADTDEATIVQIIQAEAQAVNTKDMSIIETIFAEDAIIRNALEEGPGNNPMTHYTTLFANFDFRELIHFDILPVGPGITENVAYFTSGNEGEYKMGNGDWQPLSNGSLSTTQYGSDQWTLQRNSAGCWEITKFTFNAGHVPFPAEASTEATTPPTSTGTFFQNFEDNNGTPPGENNYFWDAWFMTCSFADSPVQEGMRAVRCDAQAEAGGNPGDHGGTVGINPASSNSIDLAAATTVSVWVYDTQGNNSIELKLRDNNDTVSNGVWSTESAVMDTWTELTWSLSQFTGVDTSQIKNIELYEWNDGTYYFDGVGWQ